MTAFVIHQTKFIDVPFTVFADINASPPTIDNSSVASVSCPSGKCTVGMVSTNPRAFSVRGDIITGGQPVNVIVTCAGKSDVCTFEVIALPPPPAVPAVQIGTTAGAEYDGPAH